MTDTQNDLLLMRYLLGTLPPGEAERLDELSITDDEFAFRLSAAENDLVDSYVRGDLPTESADQFESAYLATSQRRQKLKFAQALFTFQQKASLQRVAAQQTSEKIISQKAAAVGRTTFEPEMRPEKKRQASWTLFSMPRLIPQWGFAGAAFLFLIAGSYLFISNQQLKEQVRRSESERAGLAQHEQQLQHQLESQTASSTANSSPASQPQSNQPADGIEHLKIAAFVLAPSLRGNAPPPVVAVGRDTELVILKLELEATDFPQYQVAVEDSATRQTVYSSADLKSLAEGEKQTVSFAFRKNLLKPKNYLVQVNGITASGTAEPISSYPFKAVIK